jgi:H+/Cl- antiporter ClcA
LIFFAIWYLFTIYTSGTAVPSGIFMPCILVGCAYGRVYGIILEHWFPDNPNIHGQSYSIIGAAAMLSGSTRLTYSLAVIMLETTQNVNLFLPILFSLFASYGAGSVFNKSLYIGALRSKNIPVLEKSTPK